MKLKSCLTFAFLLSASCSVTLPVRAQPPATVPPEMKSQAAAPKERTLSPGEFDKEFGAMPPLILETENEPLADVFAEITRQSGVK
ncbi:MAG TPA: hypothetical protein VF719_03125, partial [Abditibacteriaceae bacterium]